MVHRTLVPETGHDANAVPRQRGGNIWVGSGTTASGMTAAKADLLGLGVI